MSNLPLRPGMYLAAGVILGVIGGWLFYRLWRGLLPRTRSREFWTALPVSVRGMLSSEDASDMLHHYRALLAATIRYAGRNTLAVLVGIAPLTAIFLLLEALDHGLTARLDANPFSPDLSDLDLTLLVAATCGSGAAAWWSRRKKADAP